MSDQYVMDDAPGEVRVLDLSAAARADPLVAQYLLAQLQALAGELGDVLLPKKASG